MITTPSAEQLVEVIANLKSMDIVDKKLLLLKIQNLDSDKIAIIYQALLKLQKAEDNYIQTIDRIDLKYELKFKEAFADSKELKPKRQ